MSERTYYKRESFAQDETIEYARWVKSCDPETAEWFEHSAMLHGDYVGCGAIGVSNIRVLRRDFADLEGVAYWVCSGSYGTQSVRFDIRVERNEDPWRSDEIKALAEMLDGLDDYMIADESDESDAKQEEYQEAWDNYGVSAMCSALAEAYPHHCSDFYKVIPQEALILAWEALNPSGEYCVHEQGGAYIPFDRTFGPRAGMCKPSYAEVRTALRDAIFESTRRSKCHHARPMTGPQECFTCSKCGGMTAGWERGETVVPQ